MESPSRAPSPFPRRVVIHSWALYDLANTIFSAIVITRYFVLAMDSRGAALWTSLANIASMAAAGIASPYAGMLMDRIGRGRLLLFLSTLACVVCTAALGLDLALWALILLFALANFFYNLALVFYNSFIPHLGPPEEQGRISGLGTGMGYVGVIPALIFAGFLKARSGSEALIYPMAAASFLVLSIPALITLPRIPPSPAPASPGRPLRDLGRSAARILSDLPARRFFLGNLLCTDVLNALIFFIMPFVTNAFAFSDADRDRYQMLLVVSNIVASFIVGWLSDRSTARRAFIFSAGCLAAALLVAGLVGSRAVFFAATVPLAGFGLGGIWTAGRKLLFELSPPERLGEYSGFYGLTGKVSSFTTILYAGIVHFGEGPLGESAAHRAAVLALAVPAIAGLWLIYRMEEPAGRGYRDHTPMGVGPGGTGPGAPGGAGPGQAPRGVTAGSP